MPKQRDTVTYLLRDGGKIVYVGVTDDLRRREQEHRNEGKRFTRAPAITRVTTKEKAKEVERERLKIYRRYNGKNPKYNRDSDG